MLDINESNTKAITSYVKDMGLGGNIRGVNI